MSSRKYYMAKQQKMAKEKIDREEKNKKELDSIIERGRAIAKKIRDNRKRLKGEDLANYNKMIEAVVKYLKEADKWIKSNSPSMADEYMSNAENHWSMNIK